MGRNYSQLTLEERCRLCGMMEMGLSKAEIARRLGRDRLTVYREIGRNRCVDGYRPDSAERRAGRAGSGVRGSRIPPACAQSQTGFECVPLRSQSNARPQEDPWPIRLLYHSPQVVVRRLFGECLNMLISLDSFSGRL